MNVTIEDVRIASACRVGKGVRVKVDDDLYRYLLIILAKMVDNGKPASNVMAVLHTLLEIGIETGINAGMKEAKRLLIETADEHGLEVPEELRND